MAKGCYLTFSAASQGTLFLHWSETPVAGARVRVFRASEDRASIQVQIQRRTQRTHKRNVGRYGRADQALLHGHLSIREISEVLRRGSGLLRARHAAFGGNRTHRRREERLQRHPHKNKRARREPGERHGGRRRARRERRLRGVDVLAGVFHLHRHQGGQRARDL
ncbi:unnamed protein product, partial [Pelagomonas calceolata]